MSHRDNVERLRQAGPVILPSLLLCDFGNLEREIRRLEEAGIQGLHLDVMDGTFVPNLTYGMPIVEAVRRLSDLPLDVHLMIRDPERYVQQFLDAGADVLTIHAEAVQNPRALLRRIRELGGGSGLAIDADTPASAITDYLDDCDLVLVMSVPAGFGAQPFNETALDKMQQIRSLADGRVMLEMDGGVNEDTIERCARAGVRYFVVGSAIFRQDDYDLVVRRLNDLVRGPRE